MIVYLHAGALLPYHKYNTLTQLTIGLQLINSHLLITFKLTDSICR